MQCVGFITTLQRGAEWAVTGEVTQPVPYDFPSAAGVVLRPDYKEITLDDALARIETYDITRSTRNLVYLQHYITSLAGNEAELLKLEKKMIKILASGNATVDAKKLILRELSWMGSETAVAAIEKLASDADLKDEAEFALARLTK